MVMYGAYNSDTLEDLIDTVHKLHNRTTWNEKLFSRQINNWYNYYSSSTGVQLYAVNSLLFFTTVREKYVKMYERFPNQLRQYSKAVRVLSKGYLPITLLSPSKLNIILQKVRETVQKENKEQYRVLIWQMRGITFVSHWRFPFLSYRVFQKELSIILKDYYIDKKIVFVL